MNINYMSLVVVPGSSRVRDALGNKIPPAVGGWRRFKSLYLCLHYGFVVKSYFFVSGFSILLSVFIKVKYCFQTDLYYMPWIKNWCHIYFKGNFDKYRSILMAYIGQFDIFRRLFRNEQCRKPDLNDHLLSALWNWLFLILPSGWTVFTLSNAGVRP